MSAWSLLCVSLLGCGGESTAPDVGSEAGRDAASEEAVADSAPDGDREASPRSGPVAYVGESLELLTDRLCDLDGDGAEDNAIADLGPANAALFAMALTTFTGSGFDGLGTLMLYLPWVDDVATMTSTEGSVLPLHGADLDVPPDPADDLSGSEPFCGSAATLDACGEPIAPFTDAALESGALFGSGGEFGLAMFGSVVRFNRASIMGELEGGGARGEVRICAYVDLDAFAVLTPDQFGGLSVLEALLFGGPAFGIPAVPGVSPDVDIDGDGLERYELDADGLIVGCIDGDLTTIEGRDCWADPRMVDGLSIVLGLDVVSASFEGPCPGWALHADESCPAFPASPSAWGRCAGTLCERWEASACEPACGGEGFERCSWDCRERSICQPEGAETVRFESCADVVVEDGAACDEDPTAAVRLVDGARQARGVAMAQQLTVGYGAVTIEARARLTTGATPHPGTGWGIAAYLGGADDVSAAARDGVGANATNRGYAAEWRFFRLMDPTNEADTITLRAFGLDPGVTDVLRRSNGIEPALDSGTEGELVQRMRLAIHPDWPETEENEMVVVGRPLGAATGRASYASACFGDNCPLRIVPGDTLTAAVTAATEDEDSTIVVDGGDGLVVRAEGLCP